QLAQQRFSNVAEAFHLCNRKLPCYQTSTAFHQDDITGLHLSIGRTANFAPTAFDRLCAVENKVKERRGENGHVCSRHDVRRPVRLWIHTMLVREWGALFSCDRISPDISSVYTLPPLTFTQGVPLCTDVLPISRWQWHMCRLPHKIRSSHA